MSRGLLPHATCHTLAYTHTGTTTAATLTALTGDWRRRLKRNLMSSSHFNFRDSSLDFYKSVKYAEVNRAPSPPLPLFLSLCPHWQLEFLIEANWITCPSDAIRRDGGATRTMTAWAWAWVAAGYHPEKILLCVLCGRGRWCVLRGRDGVGWGGGWGYGPIWKSSSQRGINQLWQSGCLKGLLRALRAQLSEPSVQSVPVPGCSVARAVSQTYKINDFRAPTLNERKIREKTFHTANENWQNVKFAFIALHSSVCKWKRMCNL